MSGGYEVERDWITSAGFRAVVTMGSLGHRCGYVGVPAEHPLHGVGYSAASDAVAFPADEQIGKRGLIPLLCADPAEPARLDVVFDVHGGLTYSGGDELGYPVEAKGLWWFGYDCGHAGDAASPEFQEQRRKDYPDKPFMWSDRGGVHRSLDYCIAECESLASQLVSRVLTTPQPAPSASGVLATLADYSRQHGGPDHFIAARATVEAMAEAAQKALDEMYAAEPTAERFTAFQDAWDELRVSLARYYGRTES